LISITHLRINIKFLQLYFIFPIDSNHFSQKKYTTGIYLSISYTCLFFHTSENVLYFATYLYHLKMSHGIKKNTTSSLQYQLFFASLFKNRAYLSGCLEIKE
jgi:hypothetical protein